MNMENKNHGKLKTDFQVFPNIMQRKEREIKEYDEILDFLRENSNICATIIDDKGYIINECAHAYRSLVIWGKMCLVEERDEKVYGMDILLAHLENTPDQIKKRALSNIHMYKTFGIFRIDVEVAIIWGILNYEF